MYKVLSCFSGRCGALTGQSCFQTSLAKIHLASGALCQKPVMSHPPTNIPEMPACNFSPEKYKGMSKAQMLEIRKQKCNPMTMKVTYYKKPVFIHQGHMQWLWDVDGKRYLDLFAGVATVSVGHCHPKVRAAAEQQLKKLWHTTSIYVYPALHEYCEKLASYLPDPLKVIYLTNSGSEANDLAMLMARLYTGNYDIITLRGSYHGGSPQAMGLTSNAAYKYPIANGLGCTNTMCPDVFRGPWGGSHCRDSPVQTTRECSCVQGNCMANEQYIKQLKETLATSAPTRIAAFFGEPMQGVGGAVQYPKNYLKEAFQLVRERGGICIADEVQTGFGRTGSHFWGFEGHDVIPDMVTMAKGIGNGFPMGAVVTTPEIAASFAKGVHFNTFGGNPVACAVASSVLDTIIEDGAQKNSHDVGTYLMVELAKLRDKYEVIGDVRGKGLMIGVEMVKDKFPDEEPEGEADSVVDDDNDNDDQNDQESQQASTSQTTQICKETERGLLTSLSPPPVADSEEDVSEMEGSRDPLPPEGMNDIFEDVKDMGVLIGKGGIYGQTFRIKPPMCITKEDADFFLAVFSKSVHNYMERR